MAPAGEKRSFAQDFFFELMRDSQRVRAVYLAERERWIRSLEISGKEEILFELEMLLRGIDRFFNLRNLFGEIQPPQDRDWREELKATRDAVHRSVHLSRKLIEQRQEQALLFRSFVEGSLADDRARARLGAELREQRTPEESLFLLRSGLVAHQGILDHLLRLDAAPQTLFLDVGRALQHELFVSRYFCPPSALEFRAEYDRIGSVLLLEGLRLLDDEKKRKAFALGLLAAFRSLRSLRYVPAAPVPHTRRVLVILALVRSELHALIGYLESDLPRLSATPAGVGNAASAGRAAAQRIREVIGEVPPILSQPLTDRAQLDLQRDKLVEATKEAVGILANALDPALGKYALFEDDRVPRRGLPVAAPLGPRAVRPLPRSPRGLVGPPRREHRHPHAAPARRLPPLRRHPRPRAGDGRQAQRVAEDSHRRAGIPGVACQGAQGEVERGRSL